MPETEHSESGLDPVSALRNRLIDSYKRECGYLREDVQALKSENESLKMRLVAAEAQCALFAESIKAMFR